MPSELNLHEYKSNSFNLTRDIKYLNKCNKIEFIIPIAILPKIGNDGSYYFEYIIVYSNSINDDDIPF